MGKTRKSNIMLVLLLSLVAMLSCFFGAIALTGKGKISASAATVEYQDILAVENRSWGAASDEYYFGGYTIGASTANNAHWLNTADNICGPWNVTWDSNYAPAYIANNNGVDIMEYIYVNGEQARAACVQNGIDNKYAGANGGWIGNGGVCAPVFVETTNGSGLIIKILKAYAGDNFTLTFKAGFSLIRNDGNTIYLSDDVVYNCAGNVPTRVNKVTVTFNNESSVAVATKRVVNGQAIGALTKVPAKDGYGGFWTIDGKPINENTIISTNKTATPVYGVEYEDKLGVEDRTSWASGGHADIVTLGLMDGTQYFKSSVNGCWYHGNNDVIAANNGLDILEYVYIDGVSARALITENSSKGNTTANTGTWLSNPAAWPIAFETGADCWIRIDKTKFGGDFTFTLKAGFALIRNDGQLIYVSSDITYTYENGVLGGGTVDKKYTLAFDGTDVTKELSNGATIGELPAVPTKDGYTGVWTIDGVEITADTVYNYGENKTAVAVYTKDVTDEVKIEFSSHTSVQSTFKIFITPASALCTNGWWNIQGQDTVLIAANNGVDIMEYIYVNDENIRDLSDDNRTNNNHPVGDATGWLTNSDQCRPVFVETNSAGIWVTVLHSFSGEEFKVTLKAGFAIVDANGGTSVINEDVKFMCTSGGGVAKITGYTLTFEGVSSRQMEDGQAIGELPAVPTKDGYTGVWTIDGVEITADTVYNYGENKTAVAVYSKNITETIGLGDWGVPESESDIRFLWIRNNNAEIATAYPYEYWNDHEDNKNSNYGVDIMEYILIDGESVRSIINANAAGTTSYKAASTFPLSEGGCYAPIALSTLGDGIRFKVMVDYKTAFELTFKAGFTVVDTEGNRLYTTKDVVYNVGEAMGDISKVAECTLSFEGLDDTLTVVNGQAIGEIPAVPEKEGCEGYWTIDGVEITADTVYSYGMDKTAVAAYRKDISKYLALEDRAWGAHNGEFYFGVLDMSEENKVVNGDSETYYLNTNNAGTWYHGNNAPIDANNGIDIMQYIYVNDKSARELITANVNGDKLVNDCNGDGAYGDGDCWLSNSAASPVYVETTTNAGIMIKVLQEYVGNYFEITFKSGFSIVNTEDVRVYLTKDVTYKYIVTADGTTFAKGELTDAELDVLGGQEVKLMNGNEEYLVKTTCRLTLPEIAPVIVGKEGLSQVLVGWTTDPSNLTNLYPVGYKMDISAEMTLHAVWMGFELQDGAAVRLTSGSSGIRFLTDIDAGAYKIGVEKGLITGVGTFLVPTDYLEMGVDFVHSSFDEGYYLDKPTDTWKVNGETDETWTYAGAFVNISEKQYARRFSARGYLKVQFTTGEGYVYTPYTEENNARSIYEVATTAYNDKEKPAYKTNATILNYVNKVADLTWSNYQFAENDNKVGNYDITDISVDGYTVTVQVNGDVSSAVVNGKRLAVGSTSNIAIGNFLFSVSGFELVDGGFQFTLGAANTTAKDSEETLYFDSSNEDLDFFLNDYFKRHSGLVEDGEREKVNSTIAGVTSEEFFSHEWMSMSYYWYNSFEGYTNEVGNNEDRIAGLRKFLSTVPVDDYGYVWSSNDRVRDPYTDVSVGEQKMGWPFPNNDTVKTAHWEFNSSSLDGWSSNISASASGGLYGKNLNNQSSNITFTSKSFSGITSKKVYTFYAPLLEFEVRIDDATNVEDIYVWYTTNSATSFSADKKLSVKEKAFLNYDLGNMSGAYNHVLYLPMYAESAWGESTSTYLKQLKIEIALKSGKTISGNVALNYVRPTLDTRMSNNNSILISSLRQDYDFTGDLDYLAENITRARKAMNFLMQMYDSLRGLKKESYLVGHGGTKEDTNWLGNATNESIASSISQGYWDILYMPEYDFQSNVYFYKALRDMAYLEEVLTNHGITVDASSATIKTATRNRTTGTSAYSYDLNSVANTVLTNLRQTTENTNHTGFWDASDGRFVAGYASGENKWYDYGYAAWNLEAIYYGIATEEQAAKIMNWLNSEGKLYEYVFAPKSITVTGDADALNGEYAAQGDKWVNCQFGGAIMYTSFYDLMARIDTLGADNAFARLTAIQNWYKEVYDYYVANGTDPYDFYRYYYDNKGIQCQGVGTDGPVGLDREFLESFLPVSAVAYGFFGIEANGDTLTVAPEKPAGLDYWKMENLAFNFVKYDLTIYENAIQLNNVRGDVTGLSLTVALDYTAGQSVYVNGANVTPDKVENGKVYVTVAMGATIVEVK